MERHFYFCDAPNCGRVKWHTHTTDNCGIRKTWLKEKEEKEKPSAESNTGEANDEESKSKSPDNSVVRAEALNAMQSE